MIVELIDFNIPPHHESHDHDDDNIKYLLNLLKLTLRDKRHKNYSLQFEPIGQLESVGAFYNYDIVISEKYNILIATQSSYIIIYNRTPFNQTPVSDKIRFKVDFGVQLKCLKLNREKEEEFIYVSTNDNTILKINLTELLETRGNTLIWKSKIFSNLWGIDILNGIVYIVQYGSTVITLLDCESGNTLDTDPKLPEIKSGYQLIFISPKEMIISHDRKVELFHLKGYKWKSVKKTSFTVLSAYSIFYERGSQLIYLSDSSGKAGEKLKVINSKDFSLIKSFGHFKLNFGICVDPLSGLLYVCDTGTYTIEVFK